ncbi:MAG: ABC transporter substrate-binding protein [Bacteroidales bacterium]|jgi:peptide/nickel transport system substrate-binding protein|nr:ABC transporter substrate-binding protein [Bacteroidales bacterium]
MLSSLISCRINQDTEEDRKIFRYNESAGITTLDPAFARDLPHIWVCNQLYDGLVSLDEKLVIKPAIALRWSVSEDGLLYTFWLRNDVWFQDVSVLKGKTRKVKAQDVVFSFNRIINPSLASPGSWIFNSVKREDDQLAIKALNDSVLQIELSQPFPPFLGMLGMAYASILPGEAFDEQALKFAEQAVGTGPFQFQLWEEGVKLVLRRNPNYFMVEDGQQLPLIDAVSINFLADKQIAFMQFIKGKLDFMSGIDARYKDELLSKDGKLKKKYANQIYLLREPYLNTEYLGFFINKKWNEEEASQQLAMRKAINFAIDREKMLKFLRNGTGKAGHSGMIPFGLQGHSSTNRFGYSYQPDSVKSLIMKHKLYSLPITLSTTADYLDLSKFVQSSLKDFGLNASLEVLPAANMRQFRANGSLPFFRASWVGDYPDAENYLSLFYSPNASPNGPNYTHFSSEEFDTLYEQSMRITNDSIRFSLYRIMDSLLMRDAPVAVLFYDEVLRFVQNDIKGLGSNPVNLLDLRRVEILR